MTIQTNNRSPKALLALALIAGAALIPGCAAEDEVTDAAHEVEASLLQDQLDAVVEGGAPGAILSSKTRVQIRFCSRPVSRTSRRTRPWTSTT